MAVAPSIKVNISDQFKSKIAGISEKVMTDGFAAEVGSFIVTEMKKQIASGNSPVKGFGRFEPYKNPEKYPGTLKPHRPVNLSLTGTMLSYLSFRRMGSRLEVGILPDAPNKVKVIARVHNTGERDDIAQRQFIPEQGEEFISSIQQTVRRLFKNRVLEILRG